MTDELLRQRYRLLLQGRAHHFGATGATTICGLPLDGATEAPTRVRPCVHCSATLLTRRLQAAERRATRALKAARLWKAIATADDLPSRHDDDSYFELQPTRST